MGQTSTERSKTFRNKPDQKPLYVILPQRTFDRLVEITTKAGTTATIRQTIINLIEKSKQ